MSNAVRMAVASADRSVARAPASRSPVRLETLIVALAAAGSLLGALTDVRIVTALTIVAAVLVTLRRMRAEVRAVDTWNADARR